ncbi:MAG: hypothetical protein ACRC9P_09965, partial [Bacteroides sp.]
IKSNASYDIIHGKPSRVEKRGNKTLVRLNIKEVFDKVDDGEDTLVGFECYEVEVLGKLSNDSVKRAIIKDICPCSETELINNYQSYKMGVTNDKEAEVKYVEYLKVLSELDNILKKQK